MKAGSSHQGSARFCALNPNYNWISGVCVKETTVDASVWPLFMFPPAIERNPAGEANHSVIARRNQKAQSPRRLAKA